MTSRTRRAATWVVLALAAAPAAGAAQSPPVTEVVVGVLDNWPPQYVLDETGAPGGFAVEVFEGVAAAAGLRPRYRVYSDFQTLTAALKRGEVDVIPNTGVTEVRGQTLLFTSPVETTAIVVFVRKATAGVDGVGDLAGARVGVVTTNVGVQLISAFPDLVPVELAGPEDALFQLLSGDLDAFIYPAPMAWSLARRAGIDDRITVAGPPLAEIKRAMAVAIGRTDLRDRLEAAVRVFVASSAYRAAYARWHAAAAPFWTSGRVLGGMGVLLLVAVSGMAGWRYWSIRRLNRQLRFQAELIQSIGVAAIAVDLDGRILAWNRFAEQLYGWTASEVVGRPVSEITLPVGLLGTSEEATRELRAGRNWTGEFEVVRRDGSRFPALVTDSPIIDDQGQLVGVIGVSSDLSARKTLESQLRQAQKMEAIGRLAGGVAHDFNNLLTAIIGHTDLLLDDHGASAAMRDDLQIILKQANRAAALTRQLLAFSRRQVLQPDVLDLRVIVREESSLLARVIGEDVRLDVHVSETPIVIYADPDQMHQVILNLAINARDAMPRGGTLTIAVTRAEIDEAAARARSPLAPGSYACLAVRDTGVGISEEHLPHIFEPFFTTKAEGHGTGLGLATVYGVVKQSGGFLFADSRPGEGTTLTIFLPLAQAETARPAAALERPTTAGGRETILVVEDETPVRMLIRRSLEQRGYRVLDAGDGKEALALVARHEGRIDVVISDVVMPGMSGLELVGALRARQPDLKAILISGHSTEMIAGHGVRADPLAFVHKPFRPDDLIDRVRQVLDTA